MGFCSLVGSPVRLDHTSNLLIFCVNNSGTRVRVGERYVPFYRIHPGDRPILAYSIQYLYVCFYKKIYTIIHQHAVVGQISQHHNNTGGSKERVFFAPETSEQQSNWLRPRLNPTANQLHDMVTGGE